MFDKALIGHPNKKAKCIKVSKSQLWKYPLFLFFFPITKLFRAVCQTKQDIWRWHLGICHGHFDLFKCFFPSLNDKSDWIYSTSQNFGHIFTWYVFLYFHYFQNLRLWLELCGKKSVFYAFDSSSEPPFASMSAILKNVLDALPNVIWSPIKA